MSHSSRVAVQRLKAAKQHDAVRSLCDRADTLLALMRRHTYYGPISQVFRDVCSKLDAAMPSVDGTPLFSRARAIYRLRN